MHSVRKQKQAQLRAVLLMLQQPAGSREPATGGRQVTLEEQSERDPEQASRGTPGFTRRGICTMGTLQRAPTLLDVAEEIGRRCQQLEILPSQGARLVGQ